LFVCTSHPSIGHLFGLNSVKEKCAKVSQSAYEKVDTYFVEIDYCLIDYTSYTHSSDKIQARHINVGGIMVFMLICLDWMAG